MVPAPNCRLPFQSRGEGPRSWGVVQTKIKSWIPQIPTNFAVELNFVYRPISLSLSLSLSLKYSDRQILNVKHQSLVATLFLEILKHLHPTVMEIEFVNPILRLGIVSTGEGSRFRIFLIWGSHHEVEWSTGLVEGLKIQKGLNQCWTVLTWTFDSQTSSHNENQPISHFVITNLKFGLMVLAQVTSRLLKNDFFL